MRPKQIKLVAAVVGAGALLSMGGLAVASGELSAAEQLPLQPPVTTTSITTGETSTDTGAPESPLTTFAKPAITTPPFTVSTGEPSD